MAENFVIYLIGHFSMLSCSAQQAAIAKFYTVGKRMDGKPKQP